MYTIQPVYWLQIKVIIIIIINTRLLVWGSNRLSGFHAKHLWVYYLIILRNGTVYYLSP